MTDITRYGELCAIAQISSVIIAVGARQIYPDAARQSGQLIAFDWLLKYTANEQASTSGHLDQYAFGAAANAPAILPGGIHGKAATSYPPRS
jgi:hypothetical protein